ncbi:hypothetical protein HYT52_02765 [Candidatus Woesearchaeota archaeon]|nr:hypothetical protein [Candidatus Woesearchaeota archaeon]
MGWLFGKKKVEPRVPFPEPVFPDESALRFPSSLGKEKIIEPMRLKEAAGFSKPLPFPEMPKPQQPISVPRPLGAKPSMPMSQRPGEMYRPSAVKREEEPKFIKVQLYQRVLGELDGLKTDLNALHSADTRLQNSEYNEENHFSKLRRSVRAIHDDLLQMDKTLFNTKGE